jgi:DNA-binding XRE family transcriptional regulator
MKTHLTNVKDHLKEVLKDPYFRELYELDSVKTEIAKKIIEYRIKHSVNQTQLAKMVNVSQQQISYIEEGDFSSFQTIQKVLLAIGYKITRIQIGQLSAKEKRIVKNNLQQV